MRQYCRRVFRQKQVGSGMRRLSAEQMQIGGLGWREQMYLLFVSCFGKSCLSSRWIKSDANQSFSIFTVVITRVHVFTWPVALMKSEVKSITDLGKCFFLKKLYTVKITFINNVFMWTKSMVEFWARSLVLSHAFCTHRHNFWIKLLMETIHKLACSALVQLTSCFNFEKDRLNL